MASKLTRIEKVQMVAALIACEYLAARERFPALNSTHEAYGVIKEEFDEFFDEVRANDSGKAFIEIIQTGAMCAATVVDLATDDQWEQVAEKFVDKLLTYAPQLGV